MAEKLITRAKVAKALGVHAQTIHGWTAAGCPVARPGRPGVPHLYREAEVRAWRQARDDAAETGGVIDLTRARAEKEHWQAKLAEQRVKILEGELIPRDQVRTLWAAEVTAFRNWALAMPGTHADKVHRTGELHGVAGVERELDAAMRELLMEISQPDRTDAPPPAKRKRAKRKTRKRKAPCRKVKAKVRRKKSTKRKRKAAA